MSDQSFAPVHRGQRLQPHSSQTRPSLTGEAVGQQLQSRLLQPKNFSLGHERGIWEKPTATSSQSKSFPTGNALGQRLRPHPSPLNSFLPRGQRAREKVLIITFLLQTTIALCLSINHSSVKVMASRHLENEHCFEYMLLSMQRHIPSMKNHWREAPHELCLQGFFIQSFHWETPCEINKKSKGSFISSRYSIKYKQLS